MSGAIRGLRVGFMFLVGAVLFLGVFGSIAQARGSEEEILFAVFGVVGFLITCALVGYYCEKKRWPSLETGSFLAGLYGAPILIFLVEHFD